MENNTATTKQTSYIMSLLRADQSLNASTGCVTIQMVKKGIASRKEMNLALSAWAGKLDKSEASWVIDTLKNVEVAA